MTWWGQRFQALNQITEVGDHFRCASSEINRRNISLRQPVNQSVRGLSRHNFLSLRTGVYMTMDASKIAKLADIDLEDFRLGVAKGQGMLRELACETVVGNQAHRYRRVA